MRSKRTRPVVALVVLVSLTACTVWQPYAVVAPNAALPERVRLTLDTGEEVKLQDAFLDGDTLVVGRQREGEPMREFPLRNVSALEVGSVSVSRSVLFGAVVTAAGVGAVIGLIYLIAWVGCGAGAGTCD
jgi:hypothetical protein